MAAGIVYLVGAGPGDPGLLTVRGREILSLADVIIYDALANPAMLNWAKPGAELIYVGKIAAQHALPQPEINELLYEKAKSGKIVARLKGGDPYIFGRGGEEAEYLVERGIVFEEIPGISSAMAAPAYAGIPLTHRDLTSSVSIITGHEKPSKTASSHNWKSFAQSGSTLVFVMGVKNLPDICQNLIEAGLAEETPACAIYRGTTPEQKTVYSALRNLAQAAEKADITNPAVIVIGKVVSLAQKLDWFTKKPLFGKTIVVTRAREQASEIRQALFELGANVVEFPTIRIQPLADYGHLRDAIKRVSDYAWLIFTSVNGVKYFWQELENLGLDSRALCGCKIAAIGPATGAELMHKGIRPDLVPERYVAESVAEDLLKAENGDMKGKRILLPRAREARTILPELLSKAGAIVDVEPVYETVPDSAIRDEIISLMERGGIDCVTFGSSSTVKNFLNLVPADLLRRNPRVCLAAIGPVTAKTLAENGLEAHVMPTAYTIPALIAAIAAYYKEAR